MRVGVESGKGFCVYLIAEKAFSGTLVANAFNGDDQEIGRCKVSISFQPDDAKYVNFKFEDETDSALVAKYVVDLAKSEPVASTAQPEKG